MNTGAMQLTEATATKCSQPNDVDRRRIERALATRRRYRYVSPRVLVVTAGYRIESPCCSRNVDPTGGIVDVALLEYLQGLGVWRLYRKDHVIQQWQLYDTFERLTELLEWLNADPERMFWQ